MIFCTPLGIKHDVQRKSKPFFKLEEGYSKYFKALSVASKTFPLQFFVFYGSCSLINLVKASSLFFSAIYSL